MNASIYDPECNIYGRRGGDVASVMFRAFTASISNPVVTMSTSEAIPWPYLLTAAAAAVKPAQYFVRGTS
jgi:hypothetical protein